MGLTEEVVASSLIYVRQVCYAGESNIRTSLVPSLLPLFQFLALSTLIQAQKNKQEI